MSNRILIVEDERIIAEDLRSILSEMGCQVTGIASNGADALREAERNPFDLALMDIRIKGEIDGTETARILRERFDVPVVFLTAHADRETLDRAKQSKPLGYLIKPFQDAELRATVEIAMHKQRHDRTFHSRQQHLTEVLGVLLLGVISIDQAETVVLFNSAATALTGFTQEDALGEPLSNVFRLADAESGTDVDLRWEDVVNRGVLAELRHSLIITKNGARKPIVGNITPVRGSDGARGAVIVFESSPAKRDDALLRSALVQENGGDVLRFGSFDAIVASSAMKQIFAFALRVARSEASIILVEGETGTGKDVMARFIHYSSTRHAGPFVPINCSAIPEGLLESELFGYEPGAFSDARSPKKGLFEIANGGTLFLDEIGELSMAIQTKLLRVLETQSFRRLGGLEDREVKVRVIAATNRYLAEAVQAGQFRLDLFHRLTVIQITLPPLRDRRQDILPLVNHFIHAYGPKYNPSIRGISPAAVDILTKHDWPGNVRELRNVLERAMLIEDTNWVQPLSLQFAVVHVQGLGRMDQEFPHSESSDMSLKTSERNLILRALEKSGGNQTKAATLLGISRDVLRYRIKKLNLSGKPRGSAASA